MKNILGKNENLKLYDNKKNLIYEFKKINDNYSYERTFCIHGVLTFKDSGGEWYEYTFDSNGEISTYKDSDGVTRGFDTPEYTMEELVNKLGKFKLVK